MHFSDHLSIFTRGWNWKGFRKKVSLVNLRMYMKHQFLKSALILSSVLAFMNCSEEAANALDNLDPNAVNPTNSSASATVSASDNCWLMEANGQQYLIYTVGVVTDVKGNLIAEATLVEDGTGAYVGTITGFDGTPLFDINTADLPVVTREQLTPSTAASSSATVPPTSSATVPGTNPVASSSSATVVNSSSATVANNNSSSSEQQQQQTQSSATASNNQCNNQCYDSVSGKCVDSYAQLTGSKGEKYAYDNSCKLNCYYDPDGKDCKSISGSAPASSASQQAKSSSSQQQQQKSSSSQQQAKSSSSQQQPKSSSSSVAQGSTPNFKIKAGGRSGQGWGSRYWDCCKPHCAWSGKGGPIAKTCNAQQQPLTKGDDMVKSICDGGPAGLCNSQAPFAINKDLAYAFAAGPGNSYAGSCGSCFLLTFDGNSRHTTDARTAALKGKQMVIMISNIGYDVENGQFDMMIPGGGVGAFNGCSALWGINNLGAQHGGFLKDCGGDKKVNDVATVQKCLEDKCNTVFANIPDAKAGCLFHAQWLMAANNPSFSFQELESCPQELVNKY